MITNYDMLRAEVQYRQAKVKNNFSNLNGNKTERVSFLSQLFLKDSQKPCCQTVCCSQ